MFDNLFIKMKTIENKVNTMKINLLVYVIIFMLLSACNSINQRYNVSAGEKEKVKEINLSNSSTDSSTNKTNIPFKTIKSLSESSAEKSLNVIYSNPNRKLLAYPCWVENLNNLTSCKSLRDGFKRYNFIVVDIIINDYDVEPTPAQLVELKNKTANKSKSILDYYYDKENKKLYGLIKLPKNKENINVNEFTTGEDYSSTINTRLNKNRDDNVEDVKIKNFDP